MIEASINSSWQQKTEIPTAFRPEFYEQAGKQQIVDDLTSYLGEYRFNVAEFNYKIKISNGRLLDPNTDDDMEEKAQKAIEQRLKNGLSSSREVAEKQGLTLIKNQLIQNPSGTVVWFSPPGKGTGDYGFGFVGNINEDMLEMTAIRLENPKIKDFNKATEALFGQSYASAEDFLRSPQVVDMDPDIIKEFIHGNFEIRDQRTKEVFRKSLNRLGGAIDHVSRIMQSGKESEKSVALNTLENLALELKERFESSFEDNVIYLSDFKQPDFAMAMAMQRYIVSPAPIVGSCGMSGKIESTNVLGKLTGTLENSLYKNSNQEWFTCPKCTYKADGPVGNSCPGCGLTKEQFVEDGGEKCD